MQQSAATYEARKLLHDGAIALAEVESTGMAVDVPYVERTMRRSKRKVDRLMADIAKSDVVKIWRKKFGRRTNLNSAAQLGVVLFKEMRFESPGETAGGGYKTDEAALSTIDHPFVKDYLKIKKLTKAVNTNLKGIMREVVDGKIHCFFNLHTTTTFRSSSSDFNFQNIPVRDEETAKLIRRAFIARPGRQLVEIDYSGAEVRTGAAYHKDPTMIRYLLNPESDMHRDVATRLFKLPKAEISKPIRQMTKGAFVFAQFYGDWFKDCAKNLWEAIAKHRITTVSGVPVYEHLAGLGIRELGDCDAEADVEPGTFEALVQANEKHLWTVRFPVFAAWKRKRYEEYKRQGWVRSLTGFVYRGYMRRNEVCNYETQGSAFHCLLWALIELMKAMKKAKMRSRVVGQIHDSIVGDIVPSERDDYLALAREIMVTKLSAHYPWLIVPMEIEAEVADVGKSWVDKQKYEIKGV